MDALDTHTLTLGLPAWGSTDRQTDIQMDGRRNRKIDN